MLTRTSFKASVPIKTDNFVDFKTSLNRPLGNFFYDPWEIKDEFKGTIYEKILSQLPAIGEARVIIMKPGVSYRAHADIDDRYHFNIQGNYSYLVDLENKEMHELKNDGYWYEMDAGKIHAASNFGNIDRIQLVVRKLLYKGSADDFVNVKIEPKKEVTSYRYKFDHFISPWLNKVNKKKVLDAFDYNGSVVTFRVSKKELENLSVTDDFNIEHD